MVRIVKVGTGGPESCPPESIESLRSDALRFHSDSSHSSFEWLAELGFPCQSLPEEGAPDGSLVVVPLDAEGDTVRNKSRLARADALEALVQVVDRLLGPGGCPWDREQTHESLKRHLLEETYEVFDAIDSGSKAKLKEELGDLLLQPLMHAQMERLEGGFDIEEVADAAREKLIRRHPHVFGPLSAVDADAVLKNWDRIKLSEQKTSPPAGGVDERSEPGEGSILQGIPKSMPSLLRAFEISKRAARSGFEWPNLDSVFEKLREEERELKSAIASGDSRQIESEIGDLLFTAVNIARWAGCEPEEALRKMLNRFAERFRHMEQTTRKPLNELCPQEWDELWEQAKLTLP